MDGGEEKQWHCETPDAGPCGKKIAYTDDDWEPSLEELNKNKYVHLPWFRDYKQRERMMARQRFIFTLDQFVDGYCFDLVDKVCRDELVWREIKRIEEKEKTAAQGDQGTANAGNDWLTEDEAKKRSEYFRYLQRRRDPGPCATCIGTANIRNGLVEAADSSTMGDNSAASRQLKRGIGEAIGTRTETIVSNIKDNTIMNPGYDSDEGLFGKVHFTRVIRSSPLSTVFNKKNYTRMVIGLPQTSLVPTSNAVIDEDNAQVTTGEDGKRRLAIGQKIRAFFRQLPCKRNTATPEVQEPEISTL